MISELQVRRLVKVVESTTYRDEETGPARPRTIPQLDPISTAEIISFLQSPYEHGHWAFRADWNVYSPFSQYLLGKTGTLDALEQMKEERPSIASMRRKLSEEKLQELLRVTSRLTAINALFKYAADAERLEGAELNIGTDLDKWILQIDLQDFKQKFFKAWEIFKNKIYNSEFSARLRVENLLFSKAGVTLLFHAPRDDGIVHMVGTSRALVAVWQEFFEALGTIQNSTVHRVFAPDEALFKPYFHWVSLTLPVLVHDELSSSTFSQALEYYQASDFQHCISTLGLIAEGYLQRIYTSLIREQLSGGLTLGQTVDRLHKRIDDFFPTPKPILKSTDSLYEKVSKLEGKTEDLQALLREFIETIKEDRIYYNRRLDEITKPTQRRSPFPAGITENLNEMLKWRNAASHNSRIPLGEHEADRMLYCLICLVDWWQKTTTDLDWSKSKKDIVELLVQQSKASN